MFRPLQRRTFLKASGISLALPLLESMNPVFAAAEAPPKRAVFICTALGLHPPSLWPKTAGADYESTPYLEPLKDHRKEFTLFSGLQHESQTGRQPHDSEITWLTAARKPGMSGFRNTISIDQVVARRLGYVTRYPSITLGTMKTQSRPLTAVRLLSVARCAPKATVEAFLFQKFHLRLGTRDGAFLSAFSSYLLSCSVILFGNFNREFAGEALGHKILLSRYHITQSVSFRYYGPDYIPLNVANQILEHLFGLPGGTQQAQIFQVQSTNIQLHHWPCNGP